MNDQIPDFEPTVPPVVEYPQPKKPRRKPTRKKAKHLSESALEKKLDRGAAIRFGKAKAKKARKVAKRRGRPAGIPNKPKVAQAKGYISPVATILSVHAQIESSLSRLSLSERKAMLELFK